MLTNISIQNIVLLSETGRSASVYIFIAMAKSSKLLRNVQKSWNSGKVIPFSSGSP